MLHFLQVIFVEQDVILWGAQNQVNLLTSKLCSPFVPSKSEMYPCFSREMTIHILLNGAFLCWKEKHLFTRPFSFCLSYWIFQAFSCLCADFCTPFFPSLKRGLSWRRDVLDMSLDYKPIPIYAVVLLCWLCEYAAGWQTQLEQVGEKKKKQQSYKPALCVLGSSTVYFYCTWSINLSIDLCCHYFLILCFVSFFLCIWDESNALL